ncbi:MAG: DnaJ domain-containing protein [Promethearchaeota archaeon]
MSIEEAYDLFGLKNPTNLKKVKVTFRQLAKKYHPDVNDDENATKMFQEIYEAYEVILESLGASRTNIKAEFKDDLTWFYEWRREAQLTVDMDPFEVRYEQIWLPKIEKMLENLKKQKKKNKTQ